MYQYDKLPQFCIEGCRLYLQELERKKREKVTERNNLIDRYKKFCKNSFDHFTQHKQVVEIDEKELNTLFEIIKDYYYKKYEPTFKEFDSEIDTVKRWIQREEAKHEEDD